jgi:hypothetical protein
MNTSTQVCIYDNDEIEQLGFVPAAQAISHGEGLVNSLHSSRREIWQRAERVPL